MTDIRMKIERGNQERRFLFNRGKQWMLVEENGDPRPLSVITHEPVMLMFALEDALDKGAEGIAQALKVTRRFLDQAYAVNLVHTVTEPLVPIAAISLEDIGLTIPTPDAKAFVDRELAKAGNR